MAAKKKTPRKAPKKTIKKSQRASSPRRVVAKPKPRAVKAAIKAVMPAPDSGGGYRLRMLEVQNELLRRRQLELRGLIYWNIAIGFALLAFLIGAVIKFLYF